MTPIDKPDRLKNDSYGSYDPLDLDTLDSPQHSINNF